MESAAFRQNMRQIQKCASNTQNKETLQVVQNTTEMVPKQEALNCSSHTQTSRLLSAEVCCQSNLSNQVSLLPGKRGLDFLSCSGNQCRVGGPLDCPPTLSVTFTGRKMAALLLLLFSVGALLSSSNAEENNYNRLNESFKKGVDLALERLHSHAGIQHHFVFLRSLLQSDIQVVYTLSAFQNQCLSLSAVAYYWVISWDLLRLKSSGKAFLLKNVVILSTSSSFFFQPGFDVIYIFHHFYLKATNCPKGTVDSTGCQLRNDRVSLVCCRVALLNSLCEMWSSRVPVLTCCCFVCVRSCSRW